MNPIACGRLSDLSKQCLRIPIDDRLEGATLLGPRDECRGLQAKTVACHQRDGAHGETGERQHEGDADDPFIADGCHFDDGAAVQWRDERDHSIGGEVHGIDCSPGFEQHGSNA